MTFAAFAAVDIRRHSPVAGHSLEVRNPEAHSLGVGNHPVGDILHIGVEEHHHSHHSLAVVADTAAVVRNRLDDSRSGCLTSPPLTT